jgi:Na+-driven multidrug efflux pump
VLDAASLTSAVTFAGPVAASFLTTRYWTAHDDGDPRRYLWFALYLGVVLALLAVVLGTTPPEERLKGVGFFFLVTIGATYAQERRHLRQRGRDAA